MGAFPFLPHQSFHELIRSICMDSVTYTSSLPQKVVPRNLPHQLQDPNGISIPFLTPAIPAFEEAFITCGGFAPPGCRE